MGNLFRFTGYDRVDAVIDVANVVLGDEVSESEEEQMVRKTFRSIRLELTKVQSFGTDLYLEMAEKERHLGLLDVDITGYVDDGLSEYLGY